MRETLGHVTAPSGAVLLVDTGCLWLWSHDRPPVLPEWFVAQLDDPTAAREAADFRIEGKDADAAGRAFERGWLPRYVFDAGPGTEAAFRAVVAARGLDARLVKLPERIAHRARVDLALDHGRGSGEVAFHGLTGVAIGGLPTNARLPLLAERDEGRLRRVSLEVAPELAIASSEVIGHVLVDEARLGVFDVDALGAWRHDDAIDGLADVVFWGRDAEALARTFRAERLEEGTFGFVDLAIEEARKRLAALDEHRNAKGLLAAIDHRPHSHHWAVMKQVRASETESGAITVGGAETCTFMTTWGDGSFEVHRDLAADGRVVRVLIELALERPFDSTRIVLH